MNAMEMELFEALLNLMGVIENHQLESLDCDRSGDKWCDCLEQAKVKAKIAISNMKTEIKRDYDL